MSLSGRSDTPLLYLWRDCCQPTNIVQNVPRTFCQDMFLRFPLPCLGCFSLVCGACNFQLLASELVPSQALSDDLTHSHIEALTISKVAIVKAIALLIQVTKQMVWFDRNVGAAQSPLQQAPKNSLGCWYELRLRRRLARGRSLHAETRSSLRKISAHR